MPLLLKRVLMPVIVLICGYYGLRFVASAQIAKSFATCMKEQTASAGKPVIRNEEEAREFANRLFDCMESKQGFIAKLFFDKQELIRNLVYTK